MNHLSPSQAKEKIMHYCAYQERSHKEVKDKLYNYGLSTHEVNEIMATLITENFLNEERFAKLFAGSKFRQKKWGRNKILQELKLKQVSDYNIKIAMQEIDNDAYLACLQELVASKWAALKKEQYIIRESKTIRSLMQKGYEVSLIKSCITKLKNEYP